MVVHEARNTTQSLSSLRYAIFKIGLTIRTFAELKLAENNRVFRPKKYFLVQARCGSFVEMLRDRHHLSPYGLWP
jgi:hypothetical protein